MDGRIELDFGSEASFDLSHTVFQGNSGIYLPPEFCPELEMCYRFSKRKVDAESVINWTVVGQQS